MAQASGLLSRQMVLARLRRLGRGGHVVARQDLDHPLYLAMRVHFGTLQEARRAAAIALLVRPRAWSASRVSEELRRLHRRGVQMTVAAVAESGPDGLVYAIYRYVGSMPRARRLARVPAPRRRRGAEGDEWDEARVIEAIEALRADGKPLAFSRVEGPLQQAARRLFGSWRAAIETAGIDYASVRLVREPYTRDEVIETLRALATRRPRLALWQLGRLRAGRAARKVFGSVSRALQTAGLRRWPIRRNHPPMSRREVVARLRARRRGGKPIYREAVERDDIRLARSAIAHFGRWPRALAAARLKSDAPVRRAWSASIVLAHLRKRKGRGLPLGPALVAADDGSLVQAAIRYFGSYHAAALRVGYDSSRNPPWTRDRVIAELRRLAAGGSRVTIAQAGPALYIAAYKLFGRYSQACRAAGLEVHSTKRRRAHRAKRSSARKG